MSVSVGQTQLNRDVKSEVSKFILMKHFLSQIVPNFSQGGKMT